MRKPKRKGSSDAQTTRAHKKLPVRGVQEHARKTPAQGSATSPALLTGGRRRPRFAAGRREPVDAYRREDYRRQYRREHPLAALTCLGAFAAGIVGFVFPDSVSASAFAQALSPALQAVMQLGFILAGAAGAAAVRRARHDIEAFAMAVLGAGLLGQFAAVLYARPGAAGSALFTLGTGLGAIRRAVHLAGPWR